MGELLAQVVPLALGAAVSPVVFVAGIGVMTGPHPLRRGLAFALGVLLPLLVVTAAGLALGSALELPEASSRAKAVIDIILGAVLLALGIRALVMAGDGEERGAHGAAAEAGGMRLVGLGAGLMVSNVTTFALYVPAIKQVAAGNVDGLEKAFVVAILLAVTMALVLVPLAIVAAAPQAAGRVLSRAGGWLSANRRRVTVVICLALGAYLVAKGVVAL